MKTSQPRRWLSWAAVTVLALSCGVLGILQYRAIGEITSAERLRLYEELHTRLSATARAFNDTISSAAAALVPTAAQIDAEGAEKAYADRVIRWQQSHDALFLTIALAVPGDEGLAFLSFDKSTNRFSAAAWPVGWDSMRQNLLGKLRSGGGGPGPEPSGLIFEIPRFEVRSGASGPGPEQDWLLLELNPDYLRSTLLPDAISRYFTGQIKSDYDIVVVESGDSSNVIYQSATARADIVSAGPDASVSLLSDILPANGFGRRGGGQGAGRGNDGRGPGPPPRRRFDEGRPGLSRSPGGPPPSFNGPGRWRLLVRSRAGSLETLVKQSQRRNLLISASLLTLILLTLSLLLQFSRQAQHLAELQINFVAGVSHELRTPLTVIRTAAYNLRTARVRSNPDQLERYGKLIESESEKLERLIEDVLRFASSKAGHIIRDRTPIGLNSVIEKALESSRSLIEGKGIVLNEQISSHLPVVLADPVALRHALQNLIDNAVKHGAEGGNWIGVFAEPVGDEKGPAVQLRIADHGPGIPADELSRLFDPFFRGRRAVQDQVHGTGLGLNLAKSIIEAHGGSLQVKSQPSQGCEFTVRIPAAPPEFQNEFAYSAD